MASGWRSHMPRPFGPFRTGPPSARPAAPMRSFYTPCLPNKRALLLQLTANRDLLHPQSLTPWTSPSLPATPSNPPSPSPNSHTDSETSPESPPTLLPHFSNSPSLLPSPACQAITYPALFPLREVAGPEGLTRVHVPFSLSDMSQREEKLGSFSENLPRYQKEFLRLSQAYNLTWSDVHYILNATLTPDEKDCIWQAAKAHADHLHNQDQDSPVADEAVPQLDPHWTYQPVTPGIRRLNHMIT